MSDLIGITERGDPALDNSWFSWVADGNPTILISKNMPSVYNNIKNNIGFSNTNIIMHWGITGAGGTGYEVNVPSPMIVGNSMIDAIEEFGSTERFVLRVDPIIHTDPRRLDYAERLIANARARYPELRIRISVMDNYKHMASRGLVLNNTFHSNMVGNEARLDFINRLINDYSVIICSEPGIISTSCVSDIDCEILSVEPIYSRKGQRKNCGCLSNKHELLDKPRRCDHKCLYCYWRD